MNRFFPKTLLALTISACASHALADTHSIGQGSLAETGQHYTGDYSIEGTATPQATANQTQIAFSQTSVDGNLINNAQLTVDAAGHNVNGFGIGAGWSDPIGAGARGVYGGNVENAGTLRLNDVSSSEGFEIGNVTIAGSLKNSGTLAITEVSGGYGEPEGMYVHGAQIAGDLINSGVIDVRADYAVGLIIDNGGAPFHLGGQLINSGSLLAVGNQAMAFDIETATNAITVVNSGSIQAQGNGAQAMSFWDGTLDSVRNSGQIIATGDQDAHAIVLQGATFTSTLPSGQRGIVNTGTIQATGDAILVTQDAPNVGFEINQQAGLIASSQGAAINGNGLATLNWSGGRIEGNLIDLAAVNVTGAGSFKGASIDSDVSVSNAGALHLLSQGTQITGNLDVASAGSVDLLLSNATVSTTPYLTVGGAATFANGAHITLSASPGDFTPSATGTTYALLSAGSVQNNGLSVTSASSLLKVNSYTVDAHTVDAVVALKSDAEVGSDMSNAGLSVTPSTLRVVNAFKNGVIGKLDANDPVYQSFANASTEQQTLKLAKQLAPEVSRGGVDAALAGQNATSRAISGRIDGVRGGLSSGEAFTETGVWMQALNGTMDQDSRGGVAGYSANAAGVAVGVDGKLNPDTTVGVAYSYVNANVTSDTGNKTDVQGNALALYGAWQRGGWFTQGNLSYGRNSNDSKRYVAGSLAKGSFDSDVLSLDGLAGYGFQLTDRVLLEPRVGARYANVQTDAYTEHGSSAALHNGAQRFESGEVGAGLRLASHAQLFGGTLEPEATLMAYHDLIGDRINQNSAFAQGGSSFVVTGAKPVRDSYEGALGVNYSIHALTLGASYNYQAKSGYNADTVMFKARYVF